MSGFSDIDPTLGGTTAPGSLTSKASLQAQLTTIKGAGVAVEGRVDAIEVGGGGGGGTGPIDGNDRIIQMARGDGATLSAANDIYPDGTIIIETDSPNTMRIGNGVDSYNDLPVFSPGGGGSGLDDYIDRVVTITAAGAITRAMRRSTLSAGVARNTTIEINLTVAGAVTLPANAEVGDVYVVRMVGGSEVATLSVAGSTGTIAGYASVEPAPAGTVTYSCVLIDGSSNRIYEAEGPLVGLTSYADGPLVANDPPSGDMRYALSGFNHLAEISRTVAGSTTLVAGDIGRLVEITAAGTVTIPANAALAAPVGSVVGVLVNTSGTVALAITTDTLRPQAGCTLVAKGQYAIIGALKKSATEWWALGAYAAA